MYPARTLSQVTVTFRALREIKLIKDAYASLHLSLGLSTIMVHFMCVAVRRRRLHVDSQLSIRTSSSSEVHLHLRDHQTVLGFEDQKLLTFI